MSTLIGLLFLGLLACSKTIWSPPEKECNPLQAPVVRNAKLFSSTFAKKGAVGCLRVTWGDAAEDGKGLPVFLHSDGKLEGYDLEEGAIVSGPLQIDLPSVSEGKERNFTLFIFGQSHQTAATQRTMCENRMKGPNYTCPLDEERACWFSIDFQPKGENAGTHSPAMPNICTLNLPKSGGANEFNVQEAKEEVKPPEHNPLEERKVEEPTIEPDANELLPEVSVELTPEVPQEPLPEENIVERSEVAKEIIPEMVPEPILPEPQVEKQPEVSVKPSPGWGRNGGGSRDDYGGNVAVDSQGNVILAGSFSGVATFGKFKVSSSFSHDTFVAKLDAKGNWLWAQKAGGRGNDRVNGLGVDKQGNVIITGGFSGTMSFGAIRITSKRGGDLYVAKLDSKGTWLWATNIEVGSYGSGLGVAADSKGDILLTGQFQGDVAFDSTKYTNKGKIDAYVAKISSTGKWLWANHVAGPGIDYANDVVVDPKGNSYITGYFGGDCSFGVTTLTAFGKYDLFVAKLDTTGKWLWVKKSGTSSTVQGRDLALDGKGNLIVGGDFQGNVSFDKTKLSSTSTDIFIAKMDSKGNWQWAKSAGGTGIDSLHSLAIGASDHIAITGKFPKNGITFGTLPLSTTVKSDFFVAGLDSNGKWLWAKKGDVSLEAVGNEIAADRQGNAYVAGYFKSTLQLGASKVTSNGGFDIFLWKFGAKP